MEPSPSSFEGRKSIPPEDDHSPPAFSIDSILHRSNYEAGNSSSTIDDISKKHLNVQRKSIFSDIDVANSACYKRSISHSISPEHIKEYDAIPDIDYIESVQRKWLDYRRKSKAELSSKRPKPHYSPPSLTSVSHNRSITHDGSFMTSSLSARVRYYQPGRKWHASPSGLGKLDQGSTGHASDMAFGYGPSEQCDCPRCLFPRTSRSHMSPPNGISEDHHPFLSKVPISSHRLSSNQGCNSCEQSMVGRKSCQIYHGTFKVHDPNQSAYANNSDAAGCSDPKVSKRKRTIFTAEQLDRLEQEFEMQQYIVGQERRYLAKELGLNEIQVKVWFQNRRIKWRKQRNGFVDVSHRFPQATCFD